MRVELSAPSGQRVILHDETGGNQKDLIKTYDSTSTLASLVGQQVAGNWILRVTDLALRDIGTLKKWKIEIDIEEGAQVIRNKSTPALQIPDKDPAGVSDAVIINQSGLLREIKR
ncbi:MAG: proprotein convertase P-domain-containing protein [Candidatus Scalindua sp.]|nr:proprotein convertase P-domain-containing protein [Candidatus Scalindua sp.]